MTLWAQKYFFLFQQLLSSTDISKLLQKKGGNERSTIFLEVLGLEFFLLLFFSPLNSSIRKLSCFQVPGCASELVYFRWFFQCFFPVAWGTQVYKRFVLRLMVEKSVCMYTSWQEKRYKIHMISGTESQNSCCGLRGLVNGFRFWK